MKILNEELQILIKEVYSEAILSDFVLNMGIVVAGYIVEVTNTGIILLVVNLEKNLIQKQGINYNELIDIITPTSLDKETVFKIQDLINFYIANDLRKNYKIDIKYFNSNNKTTLFDEIYKDKIHFIYDDFDNEINGGNNGIEVELDESTK